VCIQHYFIVRKVRCKRP
jgi:hypothetical protein